MELIFKNFNIFTYLSLISLIIFSIYFALKPSKYKGKIFSLILIFTLVIMMDSFRIIKIGIAGNIISLIFTSIIPAVNMIMSLFGINIEEYITIFLVNIYTGTKKQKKAKNLLNSFLKNNPNSYLARRELASIYEAEGGMRKAIEEYVKAIEINRKDYKSLYEVTRLLEDLDKTEEAEELLRHLTEVKTDYIEAYTLLADILAGSNRHKEAANIYEEGIRNNPDSYELTYNLASEYVELRSLDKAEISFRRALELIPNDYISIYHLAQLNYIFGNLEKAEELFKKTLEHPSLEATAYFELAKIAKIKGRNEKAIAYLNNSLSLRSELMARLNEEDIFDDIKEETIVSVNIKENKSDLDILKPRNLKVMANLENISNLINSIAYNTKKEKTSDLVDEMISSNLKIDSKKIEDIKLENKGEMAEKIQNIEKLVDKYIKDDNFLNIDMSKDEGKHDENIRTPYVSIFKRTYKPYDISDDQRIKNIEERLNSSELILEPDEYRLELEKRIEEKKQSIKNLKQEKEENFMKKNKIKNENEEIENKEASLLEDILKEKNNNKLSPSKRVNIDETKRLRYIEEQERNKENKNKDKQIEAFLDEEEIEKRLIEEEQQKIKLAKSQIFKMLDKIKKEKNKIKEEEKDNSKNIETNNEKSKIEINKQIKISDKEKDIIEIPRNKRINKTSKEDTKEKINKEEKLIHKEIIGENMQNEKENPIKKAGDFYSNYKGYGYISSMVAKKDENKNISDEKTNIDLNDKKKKIEYISDEIKKEEQEKANETKTEQLYRNMLFSNLNKIKTQIKNNTDNIYQDNKSKNVNKNENNQKNNNNQINNKEKNYNKKDYNKKTKK